LSSAPRILPATRSAHQCLIAGEDCVSGSINDTIDAWVPSHRSSPACAVFRMPWPGDPRVNLQNDHGKAKAYQVRQLIQAIDKKEAS
jgi:hypothetical protein